MIPSQMTRPYAFLPHFWFPAGINRMIWVELILCSSLIILLVAIAAHIFTGYTQVAKVTRAAAGVLSGEIKTAVMVHHAHNGEWPRSIEEIEQWRIPARNQPTNGQLILDHGALHITLTAPLQGHRNVTLRPALPAQDAFGPVVWICGAPLDADRWHIEGEDRTDIPEWAIHPKLR